MNSNFYNGADLEENFEELPAYPKSFITRGSSWKDSEAVQYKYVDTYFISDALEKEIETWTTGSPVLISAQTGAGKNKFIEDVVMPLVEAGEKKILIVSNRIALNLQTKHRLIKEKKLAPKIYGDEWLLDNDHFSYVSLYTYHKFFAQKNKIDCREYDCVVFDEAHYFIADALFNNKTGFALKEIPEKFSKCLRIYLTATPEQVIGDIIDIEEKAYYAKKNPTRQLERLYAYAQSERNAPPAFKLLAYEFKRDYSYVNTKYFKEVDEIVSEINSDTSGEKWIVFVTNKEKGKELQERIQEEAVFIDAYSKQGAESNGVKEDAQEYQNIVKESSFKTRVLITTSVLDNGINLEDDELKNIVIFAYDKTMFLQMLGRKRIDWDKRETINLYLENKNAANINGMLSTLKKQRTAINLYKGNRAAFFDRYYNSGKCDSFNIVSKIFFFTYDSISKKTQCIFNPLAESKLEQDIRRLEQLQAKIKEDPMADVKEQLSWMGLEATFDERKFLNASGKEVSQKELRVLLENNLDKKFESKEELEEFGAAIKRLYIEGYGKRKNEKTGLEYYGDSIINQILDELNIQYKLTLSKVEKENIWSFVKKDQIASE